MPRKVLGKPWMWPNVTKEIYELLEESLNDPRKNIKNLPWESKYTALCFVLINKRQMPYNKARATAIAFLENYYA